MEDGQEQATLASLLLLLADRGRDSGEDVRPGKKAKVVQDNADNTNCQNAEHAHSTAGIREMECEMEEAGGGEIPEWSEDDDDEEEEDTLTLLPQYRLTAQRKRKIRSPWRNAVIIKLMGKTTLDDNHLSSRLKLLWSIHGQLEMFDVGLGYHVVRFTVRRDYEFALSGGPWLIAEHYLAVRKWEPEFRPENASISTIVVWVRFPGLPLEYYDEETLIDLANIVGKAIKVDKITAETLLANFARVAVHVNLTKPLLSKFRLRKAIQRVEYEGILMVCKNCGMYGHGKEQCGIKEGSVGTGANNVEKVDDSESDEPPDSDSEPGQCHCPDSEFSDFDKDKEESCFAVDQIWALYDTVDGMPRSYAQIKKVFKPGFKLRINCLDADPQDEGEVEWVEKELPFGCGRFVSANYNEDISDRLPFSHQMQCEKGKNRDSFVIYPRKGEIWALFNEWDINWSSDSEDGRKYKYEIVEVVSDFVEDAGVRVAYLDKVRGFGFLFHRSSSLGEIDSLLIPRNELLRFSHRIPSFKMTGTEKEGVPVGSFELDPAALPTNPDDICHPRKDNSRSLDSGKGKIRDV